MYNQYAAEKIHSFEHEQRQRQAEMQWMAQTAMKQAGSHSQTNPSNEGLRRLAGWVASVRMIWRANTDTRSY